MKTSCDDCGGKYCMCEACQSMKKTLEEISKICFDKLADGAARSSKPEKETQ